VGAKQQLDEGLDPYEHGAAGLETDQLGRALRVDELNPREIDLVGKTLAGHRLPENGDVRAGHGSGDVQDDPGILSQAVNSDDHLPALQTTIRASAGAVPSGL
jgi:hypothetical protein